MKLKWECPIINNQTFINQTMTSGLMEKEGLSPNSFTISKEHSTTLIRINLTLWSKQPSTLAKLPRCRTYTTRKLGCNRWIWDHISHRKLMIKVKNSKITLSDRREWEKTTTTLTTRTETSNPLGQLKVVKEETSWTLNKNRPSTKTSPSATPSTTSLAKSKSKSITKGLCRSNNLWSKSQMMIDLALFLKIWTMITRILYMLSKLIKIYKVMERRSIIKWDQIWTLW